MREKVTFYMKSGNRFTLKFKGFYIDKLSSNVEDREMRWEKSYPFYQNFTIDVNEIEAVTIKRVLW